MALEDFLATESKKEQEKLKLQNETEARKEELQQKYLQEFNNCIDAVIEPTVLELVKLFNEHDFAANAGILSYPISGHPPVLSDVKTSISVMYKGCSIVFNFSHQASTGHVIFGSEFPSTSKRTIVPPNRNEPYKTELVTRESIKSFVEDALKKIQ